MSGWDTMTRMVLETTQALVLEIREYRETSLLITLLTPEHGRLGAVARGARRPKSSLACLLQPFNLLQVRLSLSSAGGLANLNGADLLCQPAYSRAAAKGALARMAYAALAAEVLAQSQENDPHSQELFWIAKAFFAGLEVAEHPGSFALTGLFGILAALGYAPHLGPVVSPSSSPGKKWHMDTVGGTLRGPDVPAGPNDFPLTGADLEALRRVCASTVTGPDPLPLVSKRSGRTLMRLVIRLFEVHLERSLRGARFLEEMILSPPPRS